MCTKCAKEEKKILLTFNSVILIPANDHTCMWLHFIFISLPAPDKVKLTTEGDLSFFAKQDEVSISTNIIYQCMSIFSMYPF